MSYNQFSSASISARAQDTYRSSAHMYTMRFKGLRPNTKHKMYLENVDYTWACKGWGQNLGEDILSDADGFATVYVLYEIPFSRPAQYEFEEKQSISYNNKKLNSQNARMEDVVYVQWKSFELKSADGLSQAVFQMHFHIVMVNGDFNRIEQHD